MKARSLVLVVLAAGCGSSLPAGNGSVDAPVAIDAGDVDALSAVDTAGPGVAADAAVSAQDASALDQIFLEAPASVDEDAGPSLADAAPSVGDGGPVRTDGAPAAATALDLLFMIDNSPSMSAEQQNLIKNFPVMINELKKLPGGLPDLHVAVVTSDLGAGSIPLTNGGCPRIGGDRGIYQARPACGVNAGANFLVSAANGTVNNFQGDLSTVFSCIANLGDRGCGYEHQLQATRVALYEAVTPENKGFLRDNALLAIVLITDEDDCSADVSTSLFVDDASFPGTAASFRCAQVGHLCGGKQPPIAVFDAPLETCTTNDAGRLIKVSEVVDSIRALKPRPTEQIVVSGIFGWPTNSVGARYRYIQTPSGLDYDSICTSTAGEATAALRMKKFVESFGNAGAFFSICQDDFSPAMQQIGARLAAHF
jgi:hypothetical protein